MEMAPRSVRKSAFAHILILAVLASPGVATGADKTKPFETFTLSAAYLTDVTRNSFYDFWTPTDGGRIQFETPFYLGVVQLGFHLYQNDSDSVTVPSFLSFFLYIGWGYELGLPAGLEWVNGFRFGDFHVEFDDDSIQEEVRTESELGVSLYTEMRWFATERWSLRVNAEYRTIYTHRRIDMAFVGVGLGRTFDSPGWLREFFD